MRQSININAMVCTIVATPPIRRFTNVQRVWNLSKWYRYYQPMGLDSPGIPAHHYGALWIKASLRAVHNPKHPRKRKNLSAWGNPSFRSTSRLKDVSRFGPRDSGWAELYIIPAASSHSYCACNSTNSAKCISCTCVFHVYSASCGSFHQKKCKVWEHFRGSNCDRSCDRYWAPLSQILRSLFNTYVYNIEGQFLIHPNKWII